MTKITRRQFHMGTGGLAALTALSPPKAHATASRPLIREKALSRIVYGSCCHQDKPQPIWDAILKRHPELFIFLGDNRLTSQLE